MKRRLAAIMFTDMVGYTASTQTNEARTLELLGELEKLIRPLLRTHKGREIKSTGDGVLVEFDSALKALQCAVDIQRRISERNAQTGLVPFQIRIGIHLGDVEQRGTDILGDAVNIAARIEPVAEPGGICVSGAVHEQVWNKISDKLEKLPPKALKGLQVPMDLYRVVLPWNITLASPQGSGPTRLAVLPLANISPDPKDEYFADGLTEELIARFARLSGLCVISRTSVMQFKDAKRPVVEIGRELGAESIVEGSVRKSGNRIRVAIQLVDASQDRHVWSETYDRELEDIFAIQTDIAERVVDALEVRLVAEERSDIVHKPTESVTAYQLCLEGTAQHLRGSREGLTRALRCYQEAFAEDPNCVPALVGLSACYHLGSHLNIYSPEEAYPPMKRFATRALTIDPRSPDAHAALGAVYFHYEWNWGEAEREYRAAIELKPSSPEFYETLSFLLAILGRNVESSDMARRCLELSPRLPSVSTWAHAGASYTGMVLFTERPTDRLEYLVELSRTNPENPRVRDALGYAYLRAQRSTQAISQLRKAVNLSKGETLYKADLGHVLALSGHRQEARSILSQLERVSRRVHVSPVQWACLLESLERRDDAFAKLEEAYERRAIDLGNIRLIPEMADLRMDPRWKSIERRMGLPNT